VRAGAPQAQQAEVFAPAPRGVRRVIYSTNLAETSVTIEGVVYVVDALHSRQSVYDPLVDMNAQAVAPISRAAATQRAGRAGRVRPGHCFRLCTEEAFEVPCRGSQQLRARLTRVCAYRSALCVRWCCTLVVQAASTPGVCACAHRMFVTLLLCAGATAGEPARDTAMQPGRLPAPAQGARHRQHPHVSVA
jgi:Helicase conserved C-terminal domain